MEVTDVSYSITSHESLKRILKNVSCRFDRGHLTAVMGPSGAGKSTLLDLLANRKLYGSWWGQIRVDGMQRSPSFAKNSAYVLQDDVHYATLTVEETLQYAAWTRLDERTITKEEKQKRIEKLLSAMGLSHIRNSRVGNPSKGISGGEKKRLSIAVEVLSLPTFIFLDEPTSGLDSSIALEVMTAVRAFTDSERVTICTIHQPSATIFALFDRLVLLCCGRLIFFGQPKDAIVHFTHPALGYEYQGRYRNPAEFLLEISGGQVLPADASAPRQPGELEQHYRSSQYYLARASQTPPPAAQGRNSGSGEDGAGGAPLYAASAMTQLYMLMHRTWTAQFRDDQEIFSQVAKAIAAGLVSGAVFYGKGSVESPFYEDGYLQSNASACNSVLFQFMLFTMFGNLQCIPALSNSTYLYRRELASQAYSTLPYWTAHLLTPLPMLSAMHLLQVLIFYFAAQLPTTAEYFFYFFTITFVGSYISYASATALAANTDGALTALAIFPWQFTFQVAFAGFAVRLHDLPPLWSWAPYVCYTRWVFEGLMINQWERQGTDDATGEYEDGQGDVLGDFGFYDYNKGKPLGVLLLFFIAFVAILYYGLMPPANQLTRSDPGSSREVSVDSTSELSGSSGGSASAIAMKARRKQHRGVRSDASNRLDVKLLAGTADPDSSAESTSSEEGVFTNRYDADPLVRYNPPLRTESFKASSGVVPRARGCLLEFRNVRYSVAHTSKHAADTQVLHGASGRVLPGEMCCIMGASGAGKTSLLNILAQRICVGAVSGDVRYDGSAEMKSSAYVRQSDVHMSMLTVRECVWYAAELRLSGSLDQAQRDARVSKVLGIVGLEEVKDSLVGSPSARGISGGQLKRLSIAVEIVHLPDLLLLDEPTTGLDSAISLQVVCALRNLANQNRTVVCTIHQPSEDAFELFDSVLLMGGGRVIYFGPTNQAVPFFVNSMFRFPTPAAAANPADFIVAAAGGNLPAHDGRMPTSAELASYFDSTESWRILSKALQVAFELPVKVTAPAGGAAKGWEVESRELFLHKLYILLHRRVLVMRREWRLSTFLLVRELVTALFYGSVWYQIGHGADGHLYTDRLSMFYFCMMTMIFGSHLEKVSSLIEDRLIFYRERGAYTYGALSYWLSVWLPNLPLYTLVGVVYCAVLYPMVGLREGSDRFGTFLFFILAVGFTGMFMIYFVTTMSPSTEVALNLLPILLMMQMQPAGFYVYLPDLVPAVQSWLPCLSFMRFTLQGMILNEFQDNSDLSKGTYYIHEFGFNTISIGGCAAIVLLFIAVFAGSFFLALKYVDFE
jgi:ATP-binding cassette subfamily G (WHITE) protein 2 (SNQ2)